MIYRTLILPEVVYGCETWLVTMREERRLRVFQNRVMTIFGPKRDEITRKWRKLHNDELNNLYSSPNTDRVIKIENEMGGEGSMYGRRGEEKRIQSFGGET